MSFNASFLSGLRSNGNLKPAAPRLARLLAPVIEREQLALWYEAPEMRYARFNYEPTRKAALLQPPVPLAPVEPEFPAISGRIAYCNGRYISAGETSVLYRPNGRRTFNTEWHALAQVRA
jgi:hypothetical protein